MANNDDHENGPKPKLHVLMLPWFALGHITPFLHLANKLAQRGHKASLLLPNKAIIHLQHHNLHPHLITFHQLTLPAVPGLPQDVETTSDLPPSSHPLLIQAFDLTHDQVQALLSALAPGIVFYDLLAHWLPGIIANSAIKVKTVMYSVVGATWACQAVTRDTSGWAVDYLDTEFGMGTTLHNRLKTAVTDSDAICFRTCTGVGVDEEIIERSNKIRKKTLLLTGPVLPEEEDGLLSSLDPIWDKWLNTFCDSKVIYCALGSQIVLEKDQFLEIILGLEATGLPFLAVLKPPVGSTSIKEALPEGFKERVEGRGVVHDGWVQQSLILKHPSVGCYVCHFGYGSMWEGLLSECKIVGLPFLHDQILSAKMMAEEMKAAAVAERDIIHGRVSKESLCEAIKSVMDEKSEIGLMVRKNHLKYREVLTKEGFMSGCIDKLLEDLQNLKYA